MRRNPFAFGKMALAAALLLGAGSPIANSMNVGGATASSGKIDTALAARDGHSIGKSNIMRRLYGMSTLNEGHGCPWPGRTAARARHSCWGNGRRP